MDHWAFKFTIWFSSMLLAVCLIEDKEVWQYIKEAWRKMMKKFLLVVICSMLAGYALADAVTTDVATKTLFNIQIPTALFTGLVTMLAYGLTLLYNKFRGNIPATLTVFVPVVLGAIASFATGDWTYFTGGFGATTLDQIIKQSAQHVGITEQTVSVPVTQLTTKQTADLLPPKV
jgi:hypothetical protein